MNVKMQELKTRIEELEAALKVERIEVRALRGGLEELLKLSKVVVDHIRFECVEENKPYPVGYKELDEFIGDGVL
jgi:hypothetical protein